MTIFPGNSATYPRQLEASLRKRFPLLGLDVINAGVSGYSSMESLINLQFRVLALEPDLIIIYHAINDVGTRLVDPELYRSDNSGRRKAWTEPVTPFLARHSYLARIVSHRLDPPFFGFNLRNFVDANDYLVLCPVNRVVIKVARHYNTGTHSLIQEVDRCLQYDGWNLATRIGGNCKQRRGLRRANNARC